MRELACVFYVILFNCKMPMQVLFQIQFPQNKCFGCLSGPPGFTCWISFAAVFSLIYC